MAIGIKNFLEYFQLDNSLIKRNFCSNLKDNTDFAVYDITNLEAVEENKKHFASLASILSIENGYFGARSCFEECYANISTGATYIAGIYMVNDDLFSDKLAVMPDWSRTCIFIEEESLDLVSQKALEHKKYFDIKQGISVREARFMDSQGRITRLRTEKFASLKDKHLGGQSLSITPENYSGEITVRTGIDGNIVNVGDAIFKKKNHEDCIILTVDLPETKFGSGEINFSRQVSMTKKNFISSESSRPKKFLGQNENYIFEEYDFKVESGKEIKINSLVSIHTSMDSGDSLTDSYEELKKAHYEKSLQEHTKTMRSKLDEMGVSISGDKIAQKYANYSIARLIMAGENNGERSSIAARTLTGPSYAGHVFWDNEIFDLPFFVFNSPELARKMLIYRYHTLDGARKNRETENKEKNTSYKGARFAWESTYSGIERTPPFATCPNGEKIQIFTGTHEKHITPNVAYATYNYWQVTGDDEFLRKFGAEIIFEAARYSESILVEGEDGKLHTKNLIGPDEYHEEHAINPENGEREGVNDNAYTNVLIRHNLDIAAKTAEYLENRFGQDFNNLKEKINLAEDEIKSWITSKEKIYAQQDEKTGIILQFEGFDKLKDADFDYFRKKYGEVEAQKFDHALKLEKRVNKEIDCDKNNYKILKQPDVLMLMAMFPEKYPLNVQKANYEEYEPKTSHGSSLSTGIHSLVAGRIGHKDDAYRYYLEAGGMDIENVMGNAASGIHAASLGATWQALVKGFGGMQLRENAVFFSPNLPYKWDQFQFSVKIRGQRLKIQVNRKLSGQETLLINVVGDKDTKIPVQIGDDGVKELMPGMTYFAVKTFEGWKWDSKLEIKESLVEKFARNISTLLKTAFSD